MKKPAPEMMDAAEPQMRFAAREGYARGQEMFEQILRAALAILIEEGASSLTLSAVAARCGVKPGNLAHYFKTKQELLRALIDSVISGYEHAVDEILREAGTSPEARLARIIDFVLEDITTKRTTRLFPELWAMASHDRFIQERVEDQYRRGRAPFVEVVGELNPSLPADERELVALFLAGSLEGMTIFAGFEKPWTSEIAAIKRLATRSFIQTIASLKPGEIRDAGLHQEITRRSRRR